MIPSDSCDSCDSQANIQVPFFVSFVCFVDKRSALQCAHSTTPAAATCGRSASASAGALGMRARGTR